MEGCCPRTKFHTQHLKCAKRTARIVLVLDHASQTKHLLATSRSIEILIDISFDKQNPVHTDVSPIA